jgi:hypothetical protein
VVFCGSVQQAPVGGAPVWYMADACGGQACGAVGDTRMCVFVGVWLLHARLLHARCCRLCLQAHVGSGLHNLRCTAQHVAFCDVLMLG